MFRKVTVAYCEDHKNTQILCVEKMIILMLRKYIDQ